MTPSSIKQGLREKNVLSQHNAMPMPNASFLLRFLENCRAVLDKAGYEMDCVQNRAVAAGTKTLTEVRQEGADKDPTTHMQYIIPRRMPND